MLQTLACCCNPTGVCCVLPPHIMDFSQYIWAGEADAFYEIINWVPVPNVSTLPETSPYYPDCASSEFFTTATAFDVYVYETANALPEGSPYTQRIVLLINCQGKDFCVNGVYYSGPAQMFFADEDWNPVLHIDIVPLMQTVGCILLLTAPVGITWTAPESAEHMSEEWRAQCPDCTGSTRWQFSPCPGTGGPDITAELPLSLSITSGTVFNCTFSGGITGCYTAVEEIPSALPSNVLLSAIETSCDDAACAAPACDGPPYSYRVAYCIEPTVLVGYYVSTDPLEFGSVFREIGTEFPRYIVIDCDPPGELPLVFLPMGIEATTCPT